MSDLGDVFLFGSSPRIYGRKRVSKHDSKGGLGCFFGVTAGRAPSFHDLSVGEALALSEARRTAEGASFPRR